MEITQNNAAKETLPISLEDEMRRSYLDYAMSVIVGRALPDVRDGLKPVHRRVLDGRRGNLLLTIRQRIERVLDIGTHVAIVGRTGQLALARLATDRNGARAVDHEEAARGLELEAQHGMRKRAAVDNALLRIVAIE